MTMFEGKYYVYAKNRWLYHIILFGAFIISIKIIPWLAIQVAKYIENVTMQMWASWLLAYVLAIYIFPELGFMLYKAFSEND